MTVSERVRAIVSEQLGIAPEKLEDDTDFNKDLHADSLDAVEMVMDFEDEFDINIEDGEAEKMNTVADVIKFLEGKGIGG